MDLNVDISLSDGKIRSFFFSLSDYYKIPEERIIIIKKRYPIIIEEELPIILLIVREAGIEPEVIIELRKKGYSWFDILMRFKIYPEIIFERYLIYGPPYGKAWGYHKKREKIIFHERDIVFLSNIKFLSEYYKEEPEVIVKYKEKYPKFIDINYEIQEMKREKGEKTNLREDFIYRERPIKEEQVERKKDKTKHIDSLDREHTGELKKEKKR